MYGISLTLSPEKFSRHPSSSSVLPFIVALGARRRQTRKASGNLGPMVEVPENTRGGEMPEKMGFVSLGITHAGKRSTDRRMRFAMHSKALLSSLLARYHRSEWSAGQMEDAPW
jgi:hypothetical protein